MLYLVSVICGELDSKSYTPLRVFKDEGEADAFIVTERSRFDRTITLYEVSQRLLVEWTLTRPHPDYNSYGHNAGGYEAYTIACNKYNMQLLEETNRVYALLGFDPNSLPSYALDGYVFRKDPIPAP
jgi:hypothetical protein